MKSERTAHQTGNRNTIVEDIRQTMASKYKGNDMTAGCLYWAKATCLRLLEVNQRAIIQAGSAAWLRIPTEMDDGEIATHYGYWWDAECQSNMVQLIKGELPEMHVWVALPDKNQIVDLTTGFQVDRCRETIGQDWIADHPPDWLWMDAEKVRSIDAMYVPCPVAIQLAYGLLAESEWGERV